MARVVAPKLQSRTVAPDAEVATTGAEKLSLPVPSGPSRRMKSLAVIRLQITKSEQRPASIVSLPRNVTVAPTTPGPGPSDPLDPLDLSGLSRLSHPSDPPGLPLPPATRPTNPIRTSASLNCMGRRSAEPGASCGGPSAHLFAARSADLPGRSDHSEPVVGRHLDLTFRDSQSRECLLREQFVSGNCLVVCVTPPMRVRSRIGERQIS